MAYRTFKRVLGETSLERKCRFLFGASLLVLILGSFLWCSREPVKILFNQPRSNSRHLVGSVLIRLHAEKSEGNPEQRELSEKMFGELEEIVFDSAIISVEAPTRPHVQQPSSEDEWSVVKDLERRYRAQLEKIARSKPQDDGDEPQASASSEMVSMSEFKDIEPVFADLTGDSGPEYFFYQPVYWKESCLSCHQILDSEYLGELAGNANADPEELLARMPFRVVRIAKPTTAKDEVHKLRAFLIAMAIVTVFLSMIALYIVVRYVIVKPLQHLQEISEQVEQGNYDARAQIETRDEFEELASAFNRMLRHLVDTQGELKTTNTKLDSKVDELAQANMQLYELNRLKSEFLASVSHELRTPLNSIIGFSDVLKGIDALNDKQKRYASNIGNSGKVLLEMINDILDLAKMESGKMQVRPSEFSLDRVTRAQIDVVRKLAEDKNIDVSYSGPDDLPDVFQDQAKIQQILTNLLSNAIKFTPDGGRISVSIEAIGEDSLSPDRLALTVEDTGIGIAEEDREVIFEKFRQATPHRGEDNLTREFSGTGLGLSIIKELCKLLGGEITFRSQLGRGSAFRVELPWYIQPQAASASVPRQDHGDALANRSLMRENGPGGVQNGSSIADIGKRSNETT